MKPLKTKNILNYRMLRPTPLWFKTAVYVRRSIIGLLSELNGYKNSNFKMAWERGKKPVGAGRGGKYYSVGSHYSFY